MSKQIEDQILEQLGRLQDDQQQHILDYARALGRRPSKIVAGKALLSFAGAIELDDLHAMAQAIDEECERTDPHEWRSLVRH